MFSISFFFSLFLIEKRIISRLHAYANYYYFHVKIISIPKSVQSPSRKILREYEDISYHHNENFPYYYKALSRVISSFLLQREFIILHLDLFCPIDRNIVFFNLSSPLLGMPQLCKGNQAHPYNWAVVSCSWKYKFDINSL